MINYHQHQVVHIAGGVNIYFYVFVFWFPCVILVCEYMYVHCDNKSEH